MAITKPTKPGRATNADQDKAAESFIAGAGATAQPAPASDAPKVERKKSFMVYFDPDVLEKVDALAKRKGLSRSAWLHSLAIKALEQEEVR